MVADAALGRAARDVVRHAVALEGVDRPVVHRHRDRDDDRLLALLEHVHQALVDVEDVATRRSCSRAISNGFSRRWDSGRLDCGSRTALSIGVYLIAERDRPARRGAAAGRASDQAHRVAPRFSRLPSGSRPVRPSVTRPGSRSRRRARRPSRLRPRQSSTSSLARGCTCGARRRLEQAPRPQREHRRGRVRGLEGALGEADRRDQGGRRRAECDRPGNLQRPGPAGDQEYRPFGRSVGRGARRSSGRGAAWGPVRPASAAPTWASSRSPGHPVPRRVRARAAAGTRRCARELLGRLPAVAFGPAEGEGDRVDRDLGRRSRAEIEQAGSLRGDAGLRGASAPFPRAGCAGRGRAAPGRAWARTAAAPATTAAAALEPLMVPKRGVPSSFDPGSEVASATPGAIRSGFTRPSNARPRDEKGAISPELPLRAICGTPIEIAGRSCRRTAAAASRPTREGRLSTGTLTLSSRPSPPAGSSVP